MTMTPFSSISAQQSPLAVLLTNDCRTASAARGSCYRKRLCRISHTFFLLNRGTCCWEKVMVCLWKDDLHIYRQTSHNRSHSTAEESPLLSCCIASTPKGSNQYSSGPWSHSADIGKSSQGYLVFSVSSNRYPCRWYSFFLGLLTPGFSAHPGKLAPE